MKKHKNEDSGKFLADIFIVMILFAIFCNFSIRTIIYPAVLFCRFIKGLLRPFDGDPKTSPTVVYIFPTSLGGLSK